MENPFGKKQGERIRDFIKIKIDPLHSLASHSHPNFISLKIIFITIPWVTNTMFANNLVDSFHNISKA